MKFIVIALIAITTLISGCDKPEANIPNKAETTKTWASDNEWRISESTKTIEHLWK